MIQMMLSLVLCSFFLKYSIGLAFDLSSEVEEFFLAKEISDPTGREKELVRTLLRRVFRLQQVKRNTAFRIRKNLTRAATDTDAQLAVIDLIFVRNTFEDFISRYLRKCAGTRIKKAETVSKIFERFFTKTCCEPNDEELDIMVSKMLEFLKQANTTTGRFITDAEYVYHESYKFIIKYRKHCVIEFDEDACRFTTQLAPQMSKSVKYVFGKVHECLAEPAYRKRVRGDSKGKS